MCMPWKVLIPEADGSDDPRGACRSTDDWLCPNDSQGWQEKTKRIAGKALAGTAAVPDDGAHGTMAWLLLAVPVLGLVFFAGTQMKTAAKEVEERVALTEEEDAAARRAPHDDDEAPEKEQEAPEQL